MYLILKLCLKLMPIIVREKKLSTTINNDLNSGEFCFFNLKK